MSAAAGTFPAPKDVVVPKDVAAFSSDAATGDAEPKRELPEGLKDEADAPRDGAGGGTEQDIGFRFSLWDHFDKLKDNQSLKRWKEQILGKAEVSASAVGCHGATKEPEVRILSLAIQSPGRPDLVLPIHDRVSANSRRNSLFSLKEGSSYHTRFTFLVSNGTVPGLKYTYTVWKAGIRVDNTKIQIGNFGPREEAYTHDLPEEIIPCGLFARGSYFVRTKFVDDEGRCYMDFSYYFEIRKNWQ
ncbi:hypothetical protein MLD38_028185 [Melastoma candidum]|uniref:Uncharacterized protein n=1 Tax=Melastoma candidum TaxID=119954 RepID=A0ACB9N042_9MYRT|nr:hypothetical protein MLD38_028185 [Melastoma candidum]